MDIISAILRRDLITVVAWVITLLIKLRISWFLWKHYSFPSLPWYWVVQVLLIFATYLFSWLGSGLRNGGGFLLLFIPITGSFLLTLLPVGADCANVLSQARPELDSSAFRWAKRIRRATKDIGIGAVVLFCLGSIAVTIAMLASSSKP